MTKKNGNANKTIIPAYQSYNWLIPRGDNNNNLVGFRRLPVLAWSISNGPCSGCDTEAMLVTPITFHGELDVKYGALQLPDGRVYLWPWGMEFNCEADLLAWWMEQKKEPEADPCDVPDVN
jgi:hypothetical protein